MPADINTTDLIAFVLNQADETDLDALVQAARERRKALRTIAAAAVKEGVTVTIRDLTPRYCNGLTGTVKAIETVRRDRCAVITLDRDSTRRLALSSGKYGLTLDDDSYDLTGVPLTCCKVISS